MTSTRDTCFVGAGIGSLAAAAFPIRDGGRPGGQISILEADLVFPVEFSIRAAPMAAHPLLGITESVPPLAPHDKSLHAQYNALIKTLKQSDQPWATGQCGATGESCQGA